MEPGIAGKLFYRFASETVFRDITIIVPCTVKDVRDKLKQELLISSPLDVVIYAFSPGTDTESNVLADNEQLGNNDRFLVKRLPESIATPVLQAAAASFIEKSLSSNKQSEPPNSEIIQVDPFLSFPEQVIKKSQNLNDSLPHTFNSPLENIDSSVSCVSQLLPSDQIYTINQQLSVVNSPINDNMSEIDDDELSSDDDGFQTVTTPPNSISELSVGTVTSELDEDDEDDEDEMERIMFQKVMEQHNEHRGLAQHSSYGNPDTSHPKNRESLASRYYRNRNLTWNKNSCNDVSSSSMSVNSLFKPREGDYSLQTRSHLTKGYPRSHNSSFHGQQQVILPVRPGYLCHICGEKGHHIRNCPKGNDPKKQKKVKPATGLPRSWLRRISENEVAQYECDVYSLPDGTFAILKDLKTVASTAALSQPVEKRIHLRYGASSANIQDHLRCPKCFRLFQQAVLTPCCGETFCNSCVASRLASSEPRNSCPSCQEIINPADLSSNKVIQDSVDAILGIQMSASLKKEDHPNGFRASENGLGILKTSSNNDVSNTPYIKSQHQTPQSVPPGTIRQIDMPAIRPVPLGGRLAGAKHLKRGQSNSDPTAMLTGITTQVPKKKQQRSSLQCSSAVGTSNVCEM